MTIQGLRLPQGFTAEDAEGAEKSNQGSYTKIAKVAKKQVQAAFAILASCCGIVPSEISQILFLFSALSAPSAVNTNPDSAP